MKSRLTVYKLATAMIFCLVFSACSQSTNLNTDAQGRYMLNPQENLYAAKIPAQDKAYIPIEVSYYNDPSSHMPFESVARQEFTPVKNKFNPGFYKGIIYIDVAFTPIPDKMGRDFMLWLGHEPLDFAELFIPQSDGSWEFAGRTGRLILNSQMSFQSWRLAIPFNKNDLLQTLDKDGREHLIIRTQAYIGAPINVRIIPRRQFLSQTHELLMKQFLILGMYLLATAFILIYGISQRNKIFIILGTSAVSFILLMLQQKGFGPVYLWNSVSSLPHSPRIIYYLSTLTFILVYIDFVLFTSRYASFSLPNKTIPLLIIIGIVFFGLCTTIQSPVIVYFIHTIGSIVLTLLSAISLSVVLCKKAKEMPRVLLITTLCWVTASLLICFVQLFRIIRPFCDSLPFTAFDSDRFIMLDVIFVLLMLPCVYNAIKNLRNETQQNYQQNKSIAKELSLYADATDQLLSMSNVILNTVRLPQTLDKKSEERTRALIESAALHETDILNALNVIRSHTTSSKIAIQLVPFFKSCIKALDNYFQQAEKLFEFTTDIPDETIVYGDERLIEFLFKSYLQTIVKCSLRWKPLQVQLAVKNGITTCTVRAKMIPGTGSIMQTMALETKIAKIYDGEIKEMSHGEETSFSLAVKLDTVPESKTENSFVKIGAAEAPLKINAQRTLSEKKDSILLVENNTETARLIRTYTDENKNLYFAPNGMEAWELLSTEKVVPDIIVMEYKLPLMSGEELLSKCRSHASIKNIPIIVLLSSQESTKRESILNSGAIACLIVPFDIDELFKTINAILNLSQMVQNTVISNIQNAMGTTMESREHSVKSLPTENQDYDTSLSSREKEIARLIAQGKNDKEIADVLNISPATVATHNKKIFKKLGVHSRVELIAKIR